MNHICPQYGIDAAQELCPVVAKACRETDHFRTLREYASGRAYEGRADLGNTRPGDGVRFRGRGIFQATGRANYLQLGVKLGRRGLFVDHPELREEPDYAVWSACEYWSTRGLGDVSSHADTDVLKKKFRGEVIDVSPVEFISIAIIGGTNGMAERKTYYAIAQRVLVEPETRDVPGMRPTRRKPAGKAPAKRAGKRPGAGGTMPRKAPAPAREPRARRRSRRARR